jgi:hypothetical protein
LLAGWVAEPLGYLRRRRPKPRWAVLGVAAIIRGVGSDGSVEEAWVARWREAAPALAAQRARELREMTDAQALAAAEALLSLALALPLAPVRLTDSGLVRQQALFRRRLPP